MLVPMLAKSFSSIASLITHGIMKLPELFNFLGNLFCKMAQHSTLNFVVDTSPSFFFFVRRSFKNLAHLGICANGSIK